MHRPTDSQLLELWERAYGRLPCEQALILLAACEPGLSAEQLLQCSVGYRNACLLQLRDQVFGPAAEMVADCPQCQAALEVAFRISDMLGSSSPKIAQNELTADGYHVTYRLPNSGDLIAMTTDPPAERRQRLLARCVERIERNGEQAELEQLSATAVGQVASAMAEADPMADVRFELHCDLCEHAFTAAFDVVSFLWGELNVWAQRILLQVHTLAVTYGWTEGEILRLSPWRRQVYLNMARQ